MIADDHPIVLEGIVGVLSAESDFRVVAKCRTGAGAFRAITDLKPEVAVLDIAMPEMNGLEILIKLRAEGAETKIILLTANTTDRQLLSGIEHGARALLLKDAPLTELARDHPPCRRGRALFSVRSGRCGFGAADRRGKCGRSPRGAFAARA